MKTKNQCYVRYILPSEVDFLFEESGYQSLPECSRDLVLIGEDGEIKSCLCWKTSKEVINIWYFKNFDGEYSTTKLFKELIARIPETVTLIVCIVNEYCVSEQLALRAAGFECEPISHNTYKFTREP